MTLLFLSSAGLRSLTAIVHCVAPLSASPKASADSYHHHQQQQQQQLHSSSNPALIRSSLRFGGPIAPLHHISLRVSSLPSPPPPASSSPRAQPSRASASASGSVAEESIHSFTVKDIDGNDVSLSKYKGKVLLIVNVASRCGLTTSNYNELAVLYTNLKGEDFEILAFPCNQFGGQEPGSNQEIKQFACSIFKAEFPIFDKVDVNGENTAPVYKFLKTAKSSGLLGSLLGDNVKWNFEKFLVDKNGQVVQRYAPTVAPLKIEADIRKLLES